MTERKRIFLLDRNVLSIMEKSNNGDSGISEEMKNNIRTLKELDTKDNIFSPIPSVSEGGLSKSPDDEEFNRQIIRSMVILGRFLEIAKTDRKFFEILKNSELIKVFSEMNMLSQYKAYVMLANEQIRKSIERGERNKKIEYIKTLFHLARENKIETHDPCVIICLSALFGNNNAVKILKPFRKTDQTHNDPAHNSVSDIMAISIISLVKAVNSSGANSSGYDIEFLTMDEGLKGLLASITIEENGHDVENSCTDDFIIVKYVPYDIPPQHALKITVPWNLFPKITQNEKNEICKEIRKI